MMAQEKAWRQPRQSFGKKMIVGILLAMLVGSTIQSCSASLDTDVFAHKEMSPAVEPLHPYSKEYTGRIGWTLLHTYASFYPENPTLKDDEDFIHFLHLL